LSIQKNHKRVVKNVIMITTAIILLKDAPVVEYQKNVFAIKVVTLALMVPANRAVVAHKNVDHFQEYGIAKKEDTDGNALLIIKVIHITILMEIQLATPSFVAGIPLLMFL